MLLLLMMEAVDGELAVGMVAFNHLLVCSMRLVF